MIKSIIDNLCEGYREMISIDGMYFSYVKNGIYYLDGQCTLSGMQLKDMSCRYPELCLLCDVISETIPFYDGRISIGGNELYNLLGVGYVDNEITKKIVDNGVDFEFDDEISSAFGKEEDYTGRSYDTLVYHGRLIVAY